MNRKLLLFFIFAFLALVQLFPQRWKLKRYEVIGGLGSINMFTDLGVSNLESALYGFRFDFTRPSVYTGVRYRFTPKISGKFGFGYGYGFSKDITNMRVEGGSGFSSTTHIIEPAAILEYYFRTEDRPFGTTAVYNRQGMLNEYSTFGFYGFIGLAGIYYRAKGNFTNTEERGDKLRGSGITVGVPFGLGLKYVYSDRLVYGIELGPRLTFSDYLDGIKPQASKYPDTYWLAILNVAYKLKTSRRNIPLFLDKDFKRARGRR